MPKFYKDFRCIGSNCEDTCCQNWRVYLDKKTYKKYKKYKDDKEIKKLFDKVIKRNKNSFCEADYAIIDIEKGKECVFLDENKLCSIYTKCGEDFMGNTCKVYPRIYSDMNAFIEAGLELSCPEVCRLALLNQEKMEFDLTDIDIKNNLFSGFNFNLFKTKEQNIFWDLRNFSIGLIQNRNYTIDERMMILGIIINDIDLLFKSEYYDKVLKKISDYQYAIDNMEFKDVVKSLDIKTEEQLNLIKEISKLAYKGNESNNSYDKLFNESLELLEYDEENMEKMTLNYKENKELYYKNIIDKKSYILENYIVTIMYNTKFPYSIMFNSNLFDNFCAVVMKFAILKFNLISRAKYFGEDISDDKLINIIYKISRNLEHNPKFIMNAIQEMDSKNTKNLAHMIVILNN